MKNLTVYEVAQYITHIPGYSLLEIILMCFIPTACMMVQYYSIRMGYSLIL